MMNNDSDVILSDLLALTRTGGKVFYIYTHARPDGSIFYVGKGVGDRARDFWNRQEYHKRVARKYGERNIQIRAYATIDEEHAYAAERQLILAMRKAGIRLVNMDDGGLGRRGMAFTKEHREKLRAAGMGHPVSEETRRKISAAGKGRVLSESHKEKLRALNNSKQVEAMRRANTGKRCSPETAAKIGAANRGRKLSEEHCKKLGDRKRGVPQRPETVAKRAISLKAAWARRKAEANDAQ
jgi:hypothetical protein